MSEFTPGPWAHRPHAFDDWGMVRGADGLPVADACPMARYTDEEATHARRDGACPPTVEANARLIAAAPKLLAALKVTAGNIRSLGPAGALTITGPYELWLRVVEDAIAKAEGR